MQWWQMVCDDTMPALVFNKKPPHFVGAFSAEILMPRLAWLDVVCVRYQEFTV
jgi:hypothetical protein